MGVVGSFVQRRTSTFPQGEAHHRCNPFFLSARIEIKTAPTDLLSNSHQRGEPANNVDYLFFFLWFIFGSHFREHHRRQRIRSHERIRRNRRSSTTTQTPRANHPSPLSHPTRKDSRCCWWLLFMRLCASLQTTSSFNRTTSSGATFFVFFFFEFVHQNSVRFRFHVHIFSQSTAQTCLSEACDEGPLMFQWQSNVLHGPLFSPSQWHQSWASIWSPSLSPQGEVAFPKTNHTLRPSLFACLVGGSWQWGEEEWSRVIFHLLRWNRFSTLHRRRNSHHAIIVYDHLFHKINHNFV